MNLLKQELSKVDDEKSNNGLHLQQIKVEIRSKKTVEFWIMLWSKGEIIGVQRNESDFMFRFNPQLFKEHQKAFFYCTLRKGYARRIEFRASLDIITGEIRRNTTPWYEDEWELEETFKIIY